MTGGAPGASRIYSPSYSLVYSLVYSLIRDFRIDASPSSAQRCM